MEKRRGQGRSGAVRKPISDGRSARGVTVKGAGGSLDVTAEAYASLFDASSEWLWETDSEHRITRLSPSYETVTGIRAQAVLGRSPFDFIKPASVHHDLRNRRPFRDSVHDIQRGKEECRWVSISGSPRYSDDGSFLGFNGVGRNITSILDFFREKRAAPGQPVGQPEALKGQDDHLAAGSHAERDAEAARKRLQSAIDALDDGFVLWDRDDRLVACNDAYRRLYAAFPRLEIGRMFGDMLLEAARSGAIPAAFGREEAWVREHCATRAAEVGREVVFQLPSGRWVMRRDHLAENGDRVGVRTDITDIKHREAELARVADEAGRLSNDLERILDSLKMGVVLLDAAFNVEIVNKAYCDIAKTTPDVIPVGSSFRQLMEVNRQNGIYDVADADWEAYVSRRTAEIARGDVAQREFVRADGATTIYSVTALSGGKRLLCYYDISELKAREAALAETLERSRLAEAVLNGVGDAVFVKDSSLRFVLVNQAFADVFGVSPDDMIGREASDFVAPSEAEDFEAQEREVLASGVMREARDDFDESGSARSRIIRKTRVRVAGGRDYVAGFLFDITDLTRRDIEVRAANEKTSELLFDLRSMVDAMPTGILVLDADMKVQIVNHAFHHLWKLDENRIIVGSSYRDIVDAGRDDFGMDEASWRTHVAHREQEIVAGNSQSRELPRSDGRTIISSVLPLSGGKRLVSYFDVTDLKTREKALRDSMRQIEMFQHVLDEVPVAVYTKAEDLSLRYVNEAWCTLTGISKEDAFGRREAHLYPDHDANLYEAEDAEVLTTGKVVQLVEKLTHRDGATRHVLTRISPLAGADGTKLVVGSCTDITEVKAREAQLQESLRENEVFRSLIDNVPAAIYAKRPDLKLFYVNKGWCNLTGFTKGDAIGRTDVEIFGEEGEAFVKSDLAILESRATIEAEETATAPDGSIRHQMAQKSAMFASDGSLYLIGSTTDITELKEREAELLEARQRAVLADRAKSEFLANMSHEIRTPMNGVLGMAELLAKSELDPKQKIFTDIIVKSGNALLTIINDILDFSKIDAGQLVLDPAPFNLSEAIEDVATLVSTRAKEKDLELIVRIDPVLRETFVGDVGRLRQIITNLLGNAIKFTDSGHVLIDVTGTKRDGETALLFRVTDTGIGIPQAKLGLVFEKFSQVDASSTRRHEGTGLGLAITSRLVSLMGGRIGVESVEGSGSTFWFEITLPTSAERPLDLPRTPVDVSGARVLIVDDNPVNRSILLEQMASWKFDACAANNASEGLKVLAAAAAYELPVDCVVLDYQMPGMTGAEMARIVRATPGISDTPIIMLTSVDQSFSNASYRDIAIDAQLIKPARSSVLLSALVATLRKRSPVAKHPPEAAPPVVPVASPPTAPKAASARPIPREPAGHGPIEGAYRLDVLVAEDNEVNQLVFTQILGETDFTFRIVNNGRKALEAFGEMTPRLILMDVSMPEMNGLEATKAIRHAESGTGARVPIIGVTAHALKGDRERCLEAGMDDYLPKPISPRALLEKLDRWAWLDKDMQVDRA